MSRPDLHFVVPGSLDQRTGGYIYDARIVAGLRARGWRVVVHELEGSFPTVDPAASTSLTLTLASVPDQSRVVLDGLAMGGLPDPVRDHGRRLQLIGLVHHPLADETGVAAARQDELRQLEGEALSACAGVVVTSRSTAARLAEYGVEPDRVRAVPPGTESAPRAVGPEAAGPQNLLCVGTVIPRKGHDVLVRALARLRDRVWICRCAGSLTRDSTFARDIQSLVADVGLSERVQFVGECGAERLNALYHSSSVFVLASHYEGYGMVLTEALARGLPVVSTTGGAIPETVPADAGILVPPGNDAALAGALDDVLVSDALRERLAVAARRHAATLPTWDEAAAAFGEAVKVLTPDPRPKTNDS